MEAMHFCNMKLHCLKNAEMPLGGQAVMRGHNLPPLVGTGLTETPNSEATQHN